MLCDSRQTIGQSIKASEVVFWVITSTHFQLFHCSACCSTLTKTSRSGLFGVRPKLQVSQRRAAATYTPTARQLGSGGQCPLYTSTSVIVHGLLIALKRKKNLSQARSTVKTDWNDKQIFYNLLCKFQSESIKILQTLALQNISIHSI